ncbi:MULTISPECIES: V-type ATP synthase subunit B [Dethiosulfovibrio]|uniref:V-type ATP synthase beta chain n=2 Tax=Dethiosulfovibrio TaxID=47054 RepID=A0ABS9ENG2_9BACT|nr:MULTISPECIES: V-type ATP synthase subunit B [Dethiosulfovibrio]MCF4113591.1 V-type ATP synthase subunit B [Dethiosulfovibrio russensis]MCF4142061.1 V-type ATP synthase subunit B [Dethiosulfovibrio marinus]MCF4144216.1 V-type ATP synthase subunit B [Dethiosulfovibrio acidaminovorans]
MKLYREGYRDIAGIAGPLLFVRGVKKGGYGELVTVEDGKRTRKGQILQVEGDLCVIQLFDGAMGLSTGDTTVWMDRDVVKVPVGMNLIGKILNGRGLDERGEEILFCEDRIPVSGLPINPARRRSPRSFIQTGISTIDVMNTLVKGQKLPIFAGSGLPANEVTTQIVRQAKVRENSQFLVVFAAMGITKRESQYFIESFKKTGAIEKGVFFLNLASDSAAERLLTPRMALTVAEYFAFQKGYDVLVVMTDMLHYCNALREISAAREEVPGRRGYPGYMYSDLADLYERAGSIDGSAGSITQIPIITMPDDDMTHPVIDLSGYITEGQIVLGRDLHDKGIFPPIDVLPSLSRLMNKGIGKDQTVDYHRAMADQLYSAYAKARELIKLRLIVGDDGLTEIEHRYIAFGKSFEANFIDQRGGDRNLEDSLEEAWRALRTLPDQELFKLPQEMVSRRER